MSDGALGDDGVSQNAGSPLTGAEDGATNAPDDSGGMLAALVMPHKLRQNIIFKRNTSLA
jgi:hypothetical protein